MTYWEQGCIRIRIGMVTVLTKEHPYTLKKPSMSIEQANLVSNESEQGGAIYAVDSTTRMSSLVLSNNTALQGGALWLNHDASRLDGLKISLSDPCGLGGGLYIEESDTRFWIILIFK